MFEKITQLSQLPVFTGGRTEHALFVGLCIAIALCAVTVVVLVVKYLIKGIVDIWRLRCEVRQRALDVQVQLEQEKTKQKRPSN